MKIVIPYFYHAIEAFYQGKSQASDLVVLTDKLIADLPVSNPGSLVHMGTIRQLKNGKIEPVAHQLYLHDDALYSTVATVGRDNIDNGNVTEFSNEKFRPRMLMSKQALMSHVLTVGRELNKDLKGNVALVCGFKEWAGRERLFGNLLYQIHPGLLKNRSGLTPFTQSFHTSWSRFSVLTLKDGPPVDDNHRRMSERINNAAKDLLVPAGELGLVLRKLPPIPGYLLYASMATEEIRVTPAFSDRLEQKPASYFFHKKKPLFASLNQLKDRISELKDIMVNHGVYRQSIVVDSRTNYDDKALESMQRHAKKMKVNL